MPRSILDHWNDYRREVIPADAPAVQIQECRRAFYAGAQAFLACLLAASADDVGEDEGAALLETYVQELQDFKHAVTEGKA